MLVEDGRAIAVDARVVRDWLGRFQEEESRSTGGTKAAVVPRRRASSGMTLAVIGAMATRRAAVGRCLEMQEGKGMSCGWLK